MKIKMLRNPASKFGCELTEGKIGSVDDDLAEELIAAGCAKPLSGRSKPKETKEPTNGSKNQPNNTLGQ